MYNIYIPVNFESPIDANGTDFFPKSTIFHKCKVIHMSSRPAIC